MSKRPLGQHFLHEKTAIQKIVDSAQITPQDYVLEIGPGRGAITGELCQRAARVIAVELDKNLARQLKRYPNLEVVEGDILRLDLAQLLGQPAPNLPLAQRRWKVVANLPYYITTPIIEKLLLEGHAYFQSLVIMIQKEVAQRLQALACRQSGALSYFVNYYARPQILFTVKPGSFSPAPPVYSSVLALYPYAAPPVPAPAPALQRVTRAAFAMRRKTLAKSLQGLANSLKADLPLALERAQISGQKRPEELTLDDFSRLALALEKTIAPKEGQE